jgi:hypothetical protein
VGIRVIGGLGLIAIFWMVLFAKDTKLAWLIIIGVGWGIFTLAIFGLI